MYAVRHRDDKDDADVNMGTFFVHFISYFTLIEFGYTHSNVASTVSVNLGISTEILLVKPETRNHRRLRPDVRSNLYCIKSPAAISFN